MVPARPVPPNPRIESVQRMNPHYTDINSFLSDISAEPLLQRMRQYPHHGRITTYDHCVHVVRFSFVLAGALRLHPDPDTLMKGAMLHDFYLYDWHAADGGTHRLHGLRHPHTAAANAQRYYAVGSSVTHVIECHMWPLTITRVPRTTEAWIVCLADKCVSAREILLGR